MEYTVNRSKGKHSSSRYIHISYLVMQAHKTALVSKAILSPSSDSIEAISASGDLAVIDKHTNVHTKRASDC